MFTSRSKSIGSGNGQQNGSDEHALSLKELKEIADEINAFERKRGRKLLEDANLQGKRLLRVQKQLGERKFAPWYEKHIDFGHDTIYRYMKVAEHWDKVILPNIGKIKSVYDALRFIKKHCSSQEPRDPGRGRTKHKKADTPRTLNDHVQMMYSENESALHKAQSEAEIRAIEAMHDRLANDVQATRERIGCPGGNKPKPAGPAAKPKVTCTPRGGTAGAPDFRDYAFRLKEEHAKAFDRWVKSEMRKLGTDDLGKVLYHNSVGGGKRSNAQADRKRPAKEEEE
jgi:hypothetical protein